MTSVQSKASTRWSRLYGGDAKKDGSRYYDGRH